MQFAGLDLLSLNPGRRILELKLLANERAICVFEASQQHRDVRVLELRYSDDYQGNALAAMLIIESHAEDRSDSKNDKTIVTQQLSTQPTSSSARLEFRYHAGFSDKRVVEISKRFYQEALRLGLSQLTVTYQGRTLHIWD